MKLNEKIAYYRRQGKLSQEELAAQTEQRMRGMLIHGTTTIESKSGYGLTLPSEMKMLEVNRLLSATLPMVSSSPPSWAPTAGRRASPRTGILIICVRT